MTVSIFRLSGLLSSSFSMTPWFPTSKAGKNRDCCSHPNVINHAICTEAEVALEWFSVFRQFSCQQSIVHMQFCPRKKSQKIMLNILVVRFFCGWVYVYAFNIDTKTLKKQLNHNFYKMTIFVTRVPQKNKIAHK